MSDLPKFRLYGDGDPKIEADLRPSLTLRKWSDLSDEEKKIALQELANNGWLEEYSPEMLNAIEYLNYVFLRQCPGKNLHNIKPTDPSYGGVMRDNSYEKMKAALLDFRNIFLYEKSNALILRMLSKLAGNYIDAYAYGNAKREQDEKKKEAYIEDAFRRFDAYAYCLNHIFEQFAIDQLITRNGIIPRQEEVITHRIYEPTLKVLADPKWAPVSIDLAKMFDDYREENYPEVITKAHEVVQRFLQILVGEEGKNGKGEVSKLFQRAKEQKIITTDRFTEPIINAIQGFISSERATNSTAKPAIKKTTSSDALLVMNVVMVLLQHCLQNI